MQTILQENWRFVAIIVVLGWYSMKRRHCLSRREMAGALSGKSDEARGGSFIYEASNGCHESGLKYIHTVHWEITYTRKRPFGCYIFPPPIEFSSYFHLSLVRRRKTSQRGMCHCSGGGGHLSMTAVQM